MANAHRAATAVIMALPLLAACSDPSGPAETVGSISITAPHTELVIGATVQLQATLLNQTGAVMAGGLVTWTSADETVATVGVGGLVTAQGPGQTTITARSGDASANVVIRVAPPPCTSATHGSIILGQTHSGSLGPADCLLLHGGSARGWRLDLSAATSLEVELSSTAFEPLIWITDLQLNVVDVYASGQPITRLYRSLPAGSYIIWASATDMQYGDFQLAVRQGPPPCAGANRGSITPGQTVAGTLGEADCLFQDVEPAHGWQLDLDAPTRVQIDLTTSAFDALILITDPAMNIVTGNYGPGTDARLVITLPAGSYIVWALALDDRQGAFTMTLDDAGPYSCPVPPDTIAAGSTVSGTITASDCLLDHGTWADAWILTLATPLRVRIDLTSSQFDTFLILHDSSGVQIALDDDGGVGFNSRIEMDLAAGEYTIWATTFGQGVTGTYQLAVAAVSGGASMAAVQSTESDGVRHWLEKLRAKRYPDTPVRERFPGSAREGH